MAVRAESSVDNLTFTVTMNEDEVRKRAFLASGSNGEISFSYSVDPQFPGRYVGTTRAKDLKSLFSFNEKLKIILPGF